MFSIAPSSFDYIAHAYLKNETTSSMEYKTDLIQYPNVYKIKVRIGFTHSRIELTQDRTIYTHNRIGFIHDRIG